MAAAPTADELRELEDDELVTKLREAKEELFNLRFQAATGPAGEPRPAARRPQGHRPHLHDHARARARHHHGRAVVPHERDTSMTERAQCQTTEHRGTTERGLPQDPRGPRRQRQDGQDRRRRGRGPRQAPALRQGHPPHQQAQGARRGQRRRRRRPRAAHGDPAAVSATKRWRVVEILEKAK